MSHYIKLVDLPRTKVAIMPYLTHNDNFRYR